MSAGNDSVGEMWQETKIFDESTTLREVMLWAEDIEKHDYYGECSKRKIILTRPHGEKFEL